MHQNPPALYWRIHAEVQPSTDSSGCARTVVAPECVWEVASILAHAVTDLVTDVQLLPTAFAWQLALSQKPTDVGHSKSFVSIVLTNGFCRHVA